MGTIVSGDFEWDAAKAEANERKHGVTFDEAALALDSDEEQLHAEDLDDPGRVRVLALSPRERVLFIVITERGARDRIISARKANRHEQRTYQEA